MITVNVTEKLGGHGIDILAPAGEDYALLVRVRRNERGQMVGSAAPFVEMGAAGAPKKRASR